MLSVARFFSAFLFLAAPPRGLRGHPPARFERLAGAIMALGAAWGLVLIGLWDVSFMPTWPHRQDALVPAGVCAVATTAGLYRLAALAVIEAAVGKRRWLQWLGLADSTAASLGLAEAEGSLPRAAADAGLGGMGHAGTWPVPSPDPGN
jgi:hypothetical protein